MLLAEQLPPELTDPLDEWRWPVVLAEVVDAPVEERVADVRALERVGSDHWLVSATLVARDGHAQLSDLSLEPFGHASEVTGSVLRGIRVGAIRDGAIAHIRSGWSAAKTIGFDSSPAERANRRRTGRSFESVTYGRPSLRPELLDRVATLYLELGGRGYRKRLAGTLSRETGRVIAEDTIRDWVGKCRSSRRLGPATPGRAGAVAGPRFRSIDSSTFQTLLRETH